MSIYDFFAKLFNKQEKSTTPTENTTAQEDILSQQTMDEDNKVAETDIVEDNPNKIFYNALKDNPAFVQAFEKSKLEVYKLIEEKGFSFKDKSGDPFTVDKLKTLPEVTQINYVLSMGKYSIVPSVLLCIDFVEIMPYCIAIALLFLAYSGDKKTQLLDTGDGADITEFKKALDLLTPCCETWEVKILTDYSKYN